MKIESELLGSKLETHWTVRVWESWLLQMQNCLSSRLHWCSTDLFFETDSSTCIAAAEKKFMYIPLSPPEANSAITSLANPDLSQVEASWLAVSNKWAPKLPSPSPKISNLLARASLRLDMPPLVASPTCNFQAVIRLSTKFFHLKACADVVCGKPCNTCQDSIYELAYITLKQSLESECSTYASNIGTCIWLSRLQRQCSDLWV